MKYKLVLTVFMTVLILKGYGQEIDVINSILKTNVKFTMLKGLFKPEKFDSANGNKFAYSFLFDNKLLNIRYDLPKQSQLSDTSCGYFTISNTKFIMFGLFEEDFACELDINSLNVYQTLFKGKKYLLITCTNKGSGKSASAVICNLFDISDKNNLRYYPLWSMYGSPICFGDYNNDGVLDFLKVRPTVKKNSYKITLTSLIHGKFIPYKSGSYYIIAKLYNERMKIIKKNWVN